MSPGGSFRQVLVRCPFYQDDSRQQKRITCEGLVDKSRLSLSYRLNRDYEKQFLEFCCAEYKKCEVYRMLMEKYED